MRHCFRLKTLHRSFPSLNLLLLTLEQLRWLLLEHDLMSLDRRDPSRRVLARQCRGRIQNAARLLMDAHQGVLEDFRTIG